MDTSSMIMIGWREWIAFPELEISGIEAKVDTGARTSSLHTHDYELKSVGSETWVCFHLHPVPGREEVMLTCEAKVVGFRDVKNSGGMVEYRPFIRTKAIMGDYEWEMDINLANRESLAYRMLLGREGISSRFLVDVSSKFLQGNDLEPNYQ